MSDEQRDGADDEHGRPAAVCFLCGRESTSSNKVKAGKMRQLREIWPSARAMYVRLAPGMVCAAAAPDHSHCRGYLRTAHQSYCDSGAAEPVISLDVMARCYPVRQLDSFLSPDLDAVAHRRCRGGLLCLLRFVRQLRAMPGLDAMVASLEGRPTTDGSGGGATMAAPALSPVSAADVTTKVRFVTWAASRWCSYGRQSLFCAAPHASVFFSCCVLPLQ